LESCIWNDAVIPRDCPYAGPACAGSQTTGCRCRVRASPRRAPGSRARAAEVEHPADAELVFDDAEGGAPGGIEDGHDWLTGGGQAVEDAAELGLVIEVERDAHGAAARGLRRLFGAVAQHYQGVAEA